MSNGRTSEVHIQTNSFKFYQIIQMKLLKKHIHKLIDLVNS